MSVEHPKFHKKRREIPYAIAGLNTLIFIKIDQFLGQFYHFRNRTNRSIMTAALSAISLLINTDDTF